MLQLLLVSLALPTLMPDSKWSLAPFIISILIIDPLHGLLWGFAAATDPLGCSTFVVGSLVVLHIGPALWYALLVALQTFTPLQSSPRAAHLEAPALFSSSHYTCP